MVAEYLSAGYFPLCLPLPQRPFCSFYNSSLVWKRQGCMQGGCPLLLGVLFREGVQCCLLGGLWTFSIKVRAKAWFRIRGHSKECLPLSQVSPHIQLLFGPKMHGVGWEEWERWDPVDPPNSLRTIISGRVRLEKVPSQVPQIFLGPSQCLHIHHLTPAPPLDKQS